MLELAVSKKVVGARQVCDALLNSEHLKPERSEFWIATFRLIRNVIGGVDYKGVREIMKNSIEKVKVFHRKSVKKCFLTFKMLPNLHIILGAE